MNKYSPKKLLNNNSNREDTNRCISTNKGAKHVFQRLAPLSFKYSFFDN